MQIAGFQKTTLLDYPGYLACTVFTPGCNMRCPFCHNADLFAPDFSSSEEEVLAHLKKRAGILEGVCVTGGEPTLQKDLPEFLAKVKALGYRVKLDTNGTHPAMLKRIAEEGLADYAAVDIKTSPERYPVVCGRADVDMDAVRETVSFLLSGGLPFEFRTTVVHELHRPEDFEAIAAWVEGAPRYYLQSYRDSEQVYRREFTPPSLEELHTYEAILAPHVCEVALRGVDD